MPRRLTWLLLAAGLLGLVVIRIWSGWIPDVKQVGDAGWWSVLPAATALLLCFVLRDVIPALFAGILLGGVISGEYNIVTTFFIPALGSVKYGEILLVYLWCLGGLIGLWGKTGGAHHFARWAGTRLVRDRRSAKGFTALIGLIFHQGGTISTILTGSTVRPLSDNRRVSHEELAFLVDATAAPVATLIPFNVWPMYIGTLIVGTSPIFANLDASKNAVFRTIPFNFYALAMLLIIILFAWEKLPWIGKRMREAIARVKTTGELDRQGAQPLVADELSKVQVPAEYKTSMGDFLLPLGVLLAVAIGPYAVTGRLYVSEAFVASFLTAVCYAAIRGMSLKALMEGISNGWKGVTVGVIIIGLAVTLGNVSETLGTARFIIRTTSGWLIPSLLPAILFLISAVIAFSIGTSWGTYAVVLPIAMPLAYSINPDPLFSLLCLAAVTGAGVFGDHASPLSDTTILTSLTTGSDLMEHALSQLPLALLAVAAAVVFYVVTGFVAF